MGQGKVLVGLCLALSFGLLAGCASAPPPRPAEPMSCEVDPLSDAPMGKLQPVDGKPRYVVPSDQTQHRMLQKGRRGATAVIKFCIDARGAVISARMLKPSGYPEWDQAILDRAKLWRYRPCLVHGKLAGVCSSLTLNFAWR